VPVEEVRDDTTDGQRAEGDEDPLAQLFEMLDERDFLAVFEAAWKTSHIRG